MKYFIEMVFHTNDYSLELDDNTPVESLEREYFNGYDTLEEAVNKMRRLITNDDIHEELSMLEANGKTSDYGYIRVYNNFDATIYKKTYNF